MVYRKINVFLCDFHREEPWNRWISKAHKDMANITENIKAGLHQVAHKLSNCRFHSF